MPAEFKSLLRARYPMIWLETDEEDRAVKLACEVASAQGDAAAGWSLTYGLHDVPGPATPGSQKDPLSLLAYIRDQDRRCVWLLKDMPALVSGPGGNIPLARALKDTALTLKNRGSCLVCIGANGRPPPMLSGVASTHSLSLPDAAEHAALLKDIARQLALPIQPEALDQLSQACLGLTLDQAENIWARVRSQGGRFTVDDLAQVIREKARIVRGSGYLEFVEPVSMDEVGGLQSLKRWLSRRRLGFSTEARGLGLPFPRGVLLVGVQGCGKSLVARAVAGAWQQPLLRMDVGALMEGLVGASENNLRRALDLAEQVSPCVLWVDEVEKALGGSDGSLDGGTSLRMLGTLLTWMQEKTKPVFLLATANQIDGLPPELLRKGRFDEIFFVDLPDEEQRREIWQVHLEARARASADSELLSRVDVGALVSLSDGYSGAEIAAAVIEGAFDALAGGRAPSGPEFAAALSASPPLSRTRAESIDALRSWAQERARRAS